MANESLTPRDTVISAGEPAPDFTLMDQNRDEWTLSKALESGDMVLCFFPMAFTDVCGTEMTCISQEMAQWQQSGAQMVGVSCDSFATLKAWSDAAGYRQTLLADMHRAVCKAYGLYWPELNVASRGTVIVTKGADGSPVVKWSQGREVKQGMDFGEVLAAMA